LFTGNATASLLAGSAVAFLCDEDYENQNYQRLDNVSYRFHLRITSLHWKVSNRLAARYPLCLGVVYHKIRGFSTFFPRLCWARFFCIFEVEYDPTKGDNAMQTRFDPRTGNQLSILGFGCMRLPRGLVGIDMQKSEQLILTAIEKGVNYFDTAYLYPGSEAALGTILKKNALRDKVFIATKMPIITCRKAEDFDRFFAKQLESLQTEWIDYYLMHNINTLSQWQALCALGIEGWIDRQRQAGKVRSVGFSFHGSKDEFMKLIDAYPWDFCQIQYNYADENYQAGVAGLRRAAELGMPVIIMEPLLGGRLATGLSKDALAAFRQVKPDRSPAAWALRWLWDQSEVSEVLSGMNGQDQLEDNLAAAETSTPGMLTEGERAAYLRVVDIFRATYKVPCTGCGYCMPCPSNVNIPGCFSAYNASFSLGRVSGMIQYVTGTAAYRPEGRMTASQCVACGKCERHCPQNIPIRRSLADVKRRMEPFYFRGAMNIVQRVQRAQGSKEK
jgi:predicted aldo/keto reductase-like oxidoreductase